MNISVIGLGKLGAPWAAVLASRGHRVIGVDSRRQTVDLVNLHQPPILETGLEDLLKEAKHNLAATTNLQTAVLDTEITFVIVPTPSDPQGRFNVGHVLKAMTAVAGALRLKDRYHLVVLISTVMPGDMKSQVQPLLERIAGKRCGEDFGLCYNPGFVALGSVIHNITNPDFILIGESDVRAGDLLAQIHGSVCGIEPKIARMNFVNAEIAKLAVNSFVTMKISFANMLMRICEQLAGADADVVSSALGMDRRIGRAYLQGAVSYGGPCFPRDNAAIAALGARLKVNTHLPVATDRTNNEQMEALAALVVASLPPGGQVGILGLSYKPNTCVCEASAGMSLAGRLHRMGIPVVVYDPAAMKEAQRELGSRVAYASSATDCAAQSDVLVVAVAWDEFTQLRAGDLRRSGRKPTVIDCWRVLDHKEFESAANMIVLGVGPASGRASFDGTE